MHDVVIDALPVYDVSADALPVYDVSVNAFNVHDVGCRWMLTTHEAKAKAQEEPSY